MCAPSTSASAMKMTRWYRAESRSNAAPEPAPSTWMIAAHSVFLSMSASEAFCTLRILPRIGSSAWNSESRAFLAVPSAESPSTMNSSLRSSADRQSTSLAGSAELASADLRRWFSRCSRAAIRVLAAAATLSSTALACCLLPRIRPSRKLPSSAATTWPTILVAAGVPSTSLVWPSNCGSGSRTEMTAVRPSSTSSLMTASSPALSSLAAFSWSFTVAHEGPLEAGDVRAALGRGDDVHERPQRGLVAGVPPQRDVDVQLPLDIGRGQVPQLVQHRHGLGELARARRAGRRR